MTEGVRRHRAPHSSHTPAVGERSIHLNRWRDPRGIIKLPAVSPAVVKRPVHLDRHPGPAGVTQPDVHAEQAPGHRMLQAAVVAQTDKRLCAEGVGN